MATKKMVDELETVEAPAEAQAVPEATEAQAKKATVARPGNNGKGKEAFDPTQYLSQFDGRDYLEVKWRLLWLRNEHPDARITTEIVQHNEESGFALFRAEVALPTGGKATGWGSETVRDFHDYIEAAETKALGRALAALGYGTQFCTDYDFTSKARNTAQLQVVDAPVNLAEPRNIGSRGGNSGGSANGGGKGFSQGGRLPAEDDDFDRLPGLDNIPGGNAATEKQVKVIYAIGRASKRLSEDQVNDRAIELFGVRPQELTKVEASQFIDMLKAA